MRTFLSVLFFLLLLTGFAAEPRIVSQAPALTELVCLLGQGKYLVGRSEACDYPAEVRKLPVTGRFGDPELERTLQLRPTLFLANDLFRPAFAETMRKAGIRVLLKQCRSLADYTEWVALLGRELHCEPEARAELKRIRTFKRECDSVNRRIRKPKKVLWVIWDSPLLIAGKNSLPDEVIRLAGGINVAANVPQEYCKASYEWVLANQPDVILWTASRRGSLNTHAFWKQLQAVQRGAVLCDLDQNLLQRPGPRLPDGIRALRQALEAVP